MTDEYLRCPYCGYPVWSSDYGAECTDPGYAVGSLEKDGSCGARWDCVGALEVKPHGE